MKKRNNRRDERENPIENWKPKTHLGKKVKNEEITDIDEVISKGKRIMEPEIIDKLLPDLETEFINIGQSKGKFGGGGRRIFRQTQKKTSQGNKPIFSVMAVVGNQDGYVGVGLGKSKETLPAREKAVVNAKKNIIQIARGCGSWECTCGEHHSIPFEMKAKETSIEVKFLPAPKGTGLVVDDELKKIFKIAGIKDLWSKTRGKTNHKINMVSACIKALRKGARQKVVLCNLKYGSNK